MNHRSDHQRGITGRIVGAILIAVASLLVVAAPLRAAEPGAVIVLTASGEVDAVMADQLRDGIGWPDRPGRRPSAGRAVCRRP